MKAYFARQLFLELIELGLERLDLGLRGVLVRIRLRVRHGPALPLELGVLLVDLGLGLVVALDHVGGGLRVFLVGRAREDPRQCIVILLRDRVELVVMAAGAGDGQAEEAAAEGIDAIVVLVEDRPTVVDRAEGEEARRGPRIRAGGRLEQVAGDLRHDELVVGHVGIQGIDDPLAIAVAIGVEAGFEGMRLVFAVARDVEPVPPPALAVMGRSEEPVDHPLESLRRFVGDERVDLLGRRRQPRQVERRAADQGPPGGRADGPEPFRLERAPG